MFSFQEIKDKATAIAKEHGVASLSLFGSYAKNCASDTSDLDFLISKGEIKGYYQYMAFVLDLEDAFGCHVDVVTDTIEDKDFLRTILSDRVVLYEKI